MSGVQSTTSMLWVTLLMMRLAVPPMQWRTWRNGPSRVREVPQPALSAGVKLLCLSQRIRLVVNGCPLSACFTGTPQKGVGV